MRRVLILGLYYPPANFSAARRLEGWARHLHAFGYQPLVLTRYYDPEDRNSLDFYASSRATRSLNVPWLKENEVVYTSFTPNLWTRLPLPGKVRGIVHFAWPDPDHSGWLKQCQDYLETSGFKPDIIIGSCSPPGVFRVARKLAHNASVPWIADLRDLWLQESNDNFSGRLKRSLQRRHLQSAAGITVTAEGTVNSLQQQLGSLEKPIRVIYSGAEPTHVASPDHRDSQIVEEFDRVRSRYSVVLTYAGTIYPGQRIETHLNTIRRYNESGRGMCAVVLLGRHDPSAYKQWPFLYIVGTVHPETALFLEGKSTALFYPTWPANFPVMAGKIFELLLSGRPVLVGFTPSPDLESWCGDFENACIVKGPDELLRALGRLPLARTEPTSDVTYERATRKYWAGKLAAFLDETLSRENASKSLR